MPIDYQESPNYAFLTQNLIDQLKGQIPDCIFLQDKESKLKYGHDETEDLIFEPDLVVIPKTVQDISIILKWCNSNHIPLTPRGAGTGLSGGALPVFRGIILSMEKFNRILEIDLRNQQATVESGVITQELMDAVDVHNLYYPIDPSSKGSSYIGGNVAHGSGGPRVVKFGTIRDYILNLQIVLPSGEILWTGSNTIKFASGYNLTQLMIGSEGTLAIITKVVVKLIPKPKNNILLLVSFHQIEEACKAVSEIFNAGYTPSALEFMERSGIEWVVAYEKISFLIQEDIEAYLLIELIGSNLNQLMEEAEGISEILYPIGADEIWVAESSVQKEEWWRIRRKMAESVKAHSIYKEEDTVVPRAELAPLIRGIKKIGAQYGFLSICYGHAGDGNLHINIIKGNLSDLEWKNSLPVAIREIFTLTIQLGGTLSGEHGIGWVQKEFMDIRFGKVHLNLLKGIKHLFDPNLILNPGKIWK